MDKRLFLATVSPAGVLLAAALLAADTPALAQTAPPTRVRGTIATVAGNEMTVNSRDGQKLAVMLTEPLTVLTVKKVDLNAIAPNAYVGIATRAGADGKLTALEVLVFPEAGRGSGEGHYAWDLEPGSTMTNGTLSGTLAAASGRELSLTYKGGSNTIFVPPSVPVVTFAPAERTDLKAGAPIFLGAMKDAEGKLSTGRVVVGKDGVAPPM